jgi:AraC-like DNA-binding protein
VRDGSPTFDATLHAVVTGSVSFGHLHLAATTELELAATAPRFLVVTPVRGRTPALCDASAFDATPERAAVVQPGRPVTLLCPAGTAYLVVGIEQQAVLTLLGRLLGRAVDRALVLDAELDLTAAPSSRWNLAVAMLQAELSEHGSLLRSGVGYAPLEEFLISALLYGQPSSYSALLRRPDAPVGHPATAAAQAFIEANLPERLTLAAVASAAGVSVRTLQAAFRSELRMTPTAYIRGRRLDRARGDLAGTGGAPATVTTVATRWGITHLGRFAAEYRSRFGESPSETLRRRQPDS